MNRYYKITNKDNETISIFILVDTLNVYVPSHFDNIRKQNVPATGGYIVFEYECSEESRKWDCHGNFENFSSFEDYLKSFSNNLSFSIREIDEQQIMFEYDLWK